MYLKLFPSSVLYVVFSLLINTSFILRLFYLSTSSLYILSFGRFVLPFFPPSSLLYVFLVSLLVHLFSITLMTQRITDQMKIRKKFTSDLKVR